MFSSFSWYRQVFELSSSDQCLLLVVQCIVTSKMKTSSLDPREGVFLSTSGAQDLSEGMVGILLVGRKSVDSPAFTCYSLAG